MIYILNGHVISPAADLDGIADIAIDEKSGLIVGIRRYGQEASEIFSHLTSDDTIYDAKGLDVLPGFIDLHVHLREPGFSEKETIYTGTRAMAKGGFTTVMCMPNTKPALDSPETLELLKDICQKDAVIDVLIGGAITKNIMGKELCDHVELVKAGAVAISDDGRTTMNNDYMSQAYESSSVLKIPVMTHCEDHDITEKLGGASSPPEAEDNIVFRDISLLREFNGSSKAHLHICHVSTKSAATAIAKGKAEGLQVTGEATPHHIALCIEDIDINDPYTKVNPPIRSKEDMNAIIKALKDGAIDTISTDHAPHEKSSKERAYNDASMGISGSETCFSVVNTVLFEQNNFTKGELVKLMSENPAKILKLDDRGIIKEGLLADITIVDRNTQITVDSSKFISKGKNTPFNGRKYMGQVVATIKKGKFCYG